MAAWKDVFQLVQSELFPNLKTLQSASEVLWLFTCDMVLKSLTQASFAWAPRMLHSLKATIVSRRTCQVAIEIAVLIFAKHSCN